MKAIAQINVTEQVIKASAELEVSAERAYYESTEQSDGNMAALLAAIGHEAGKPATKDQCDQWKDIASLWIDTYAKARGCDVLAAGRAWSRVVTRIGAVKPQTKEALHKVEVRQAAKAADKVNPKGNPDVVTPAKAADAVQAVQAQLSKIELHLIALIRAKKFDLAAQCIADMAK